jgi:hypothetical protein
MFAQLNSMAERVGQIHAVDYGNHHYTYNRITHNDRWQ